MTITRLHMSATIVIAMLLHGGIAVWFSLPEPVPPPVPAQPLRISLLATIAETTTNASSAVTKPPIKPEPVIQPTPVKPPAPVKPIPEPEQVELQPAKNTPEPEFEPEPTAAEPIAEIAQVSPAEASPAILDAAATARYEQLLVAWLEKHKKYPRRAKRLRIEGEGMLRILIDRTGQTRQVSLEQPTGNRLLDKAALEMAQRANPFPPMPENDPRRKLEFMVPVAFVLR